MNYERIFQFKFANAGNTVHRSASTFRRIIRTQEMSDRVRAVRMRPRDGAAFSAGDHLRDQQSAYKIFPSQFFVTRFSFRSSELGGHRHVCRSAWCVSSPGTVGEPRVKNLGPLRPLDFGSGFGLGARACYLTWCVS